MTNKNAYAQSGVDVEAGYEVVERIKKHVARTERAGVMGALGGFGGMFDLSKTGVKEPVLISGTDGVGTKLMPPQPICSRNPPVITRGATFGLIMAIVI